MSVIIKPSEIERSSMGIIETELEERGIALPPEHEAVVKRVIHTTADFDYADSLTFTADAVCALYTILLKGESGEAYNVTNMDTACSIREMAELVAGLEPEAGVNVRIEIPEDLASFGYNPQMVIRLDASKLKSIGYVPSVGMEDMVRRTIRSMRERI